MYTLLTSQVLLYMIVPGSPDKDNLSRSRTSFDNYFFEQVLHIPDHTPANESDDLERVAQLVRVERFHGQSELPTPLLVHVSNSPYCPTSGFNIVSITYDILVPPPLS